MNEVKTTGRWKGKNAEHIRKEMRKLAHRKAAKMSKAEKKRNARRMVDARGYWVVSKEGKKTYVRRTH